MLDVRDQMALYQVVNENESIFYESVVWETVIIFSQV